MIASDPLAKATFRAAARTRRAAVDRRAARSAEISRRLITFPSWATANSVSIYVDFRDEVQTGPLIAAALAAGKTVSVPFCQPDTTLGMFIIRAMTDLQPGKFGILEPSRRQRSDSSRLAAPESLDLLVIPGLAFDREGGRMGYGMGHYDRLIPLLRPDCVKVGLAFAAQLVESVPTEPHDAPLDVIVSETEVFRAKHFAR